MDDDHAAIVEGAIATANANQNGSSAAGAPSLDPNSAAFDGLAGDVVRGFEGTTEADPAGLLVNALVRFGAMVGEAAEVHVGYAKHPPALFAATVGRTSLSRKGTATTEIDGLMRGVEEGWEDLHRVSGFGSGEAFIEHAAENRGQAIYMVETELARVLANASRDYSSVSQVFRAAWDYRRMEHRIRKKTYDAPAAPVSMVAHITMDELKDARHGLRPVEIMNGFGNRILWPYVDRRRSVPEPEMLPDAVSNGLVRHLREALAAARGAGIVQRTPAASELWRDLYERIGSDEGGGVVDALTARAAAQVLRLSLIYALMDGSDLIHSAHLESAWEVWRYCRWSAQHIWVGSGTGDRDVDRIAAIVRGGEDITGRDLDRMFYGRRSADEVRDKAVSMGVARLVTGSSTPKGGRPPVLLTSPAEELGKLDKPHWWIGTAYCRRSEGLSGSSGLSAGEAQRLAAEQAAP